MSSPTILTRESETRQIIRNCLNRLELLLETPHPGLFEYALNAAQLGQGQPLSLEKLDRLLLQVRSEAPGITLELFSALSLLDLGLVGYAATSADSIGEALRIVSSYHELTSDRYRPVMEVDGETAHIIPIASPAFASDLQDIAEDHLAGTWNVLRQLLGEQARPERIRARFSYTAPSYHALYRRIFGSTVVFDADRTELVFPSDWLQRPLALTNPDIRELYSTVCERLLGPTTRESDTEAAVRTLLMSRPGRSMPGLEAAARALNLSVEQLRKRLWRQGTNYKALVLEARMVLADNYLQATSLSIQEIAYLLDYNHPGAFSRAFKSYHGVAPSSYREKNA